MEVTKNKFVDDGFYFLYDWLDVGGVYLVCLVDSDSADLVVVLEIQIGGDQLYLQADGLDFPGKFLPVIEVLNC